MESGTAKKYAMRGLWAIFVATLVVATLSPGQQAPTHQGGNGAKASVSITGVPHAGAGGSEAMEAISGSARGVDYAKHKIVIYAFAGGTWWVQPTIANPFTDIDTAGKWETDTHLGSSYAALLVKDSFKPSATLGALPGVQGDVVAVVRVAGLR